MGGGGSAVPGRVDRIAAASSESSRRWATLLLPSWDVTGGRVGGGGGVGQGVGVCGRVWMRERAGRRAGAGEGGAAIRGRAAGAMVLLPRGKGGTSAVGWGGGGGRLLDWRALPHSDGMGASLCGAFKAHSCAPGLESCQLLSSPRPQLLSWSAELLRALAPHAWGGGRRRGKGAPGGGGLL